MTDPLHRRQVLRGLGSGLALASGLLHAVRASAARKPALLHAVFLNYANGSHHAWAPAGEGADYALTPHLAPLAAIRQDVIILRNMACARGRGNPHKAATFSVLGAGAGTSFDQQIAAVTRARTPLPSLELAIGFTGGGGGVAPSLSQAGGVFLPGERNPFAAYQRVVSRVSRHEATRSSGAAVALLAGRRSVLDHLREDLQLFSGRLPGDERQKAELYLASVRDLEKNLGALAGELGRVPACGKMLPPADTASYVARVADMPKVSRIFLDVMAMALACGVTRVASMMWGGGESDEPVDFMGMRDWHSTTHGDPAGPAGQKVIAMQAYLAGEYVYLVDKLRGFPRGGHTLLDESVVVLGTQNGNTNQTNFAKEDHDRRNTPFVLAGKLGGALRPGRLIDCGGRNHNDLYLSLAGAFGITGPAVGDADWCQGPLELG